MKKNILYILLAIFMGFAASSCQEDDEYTLKKYNPKGGLSQEDFTVESIDYLKSTKEEVKLAFEFNRLDGNTANFNIAVTSIEPAEFANVFALSTTSGSMNTNKDTITVGEIDWSVLDCSDKAVVTISVSDAGNTDIGTTTESITITLVKADAPILDLGKVMTDEYFELGSVDDISTTIEIPNAIDRPAEQEIRMPLQHWFNPIFTEGTHFDIQQELVIAEGSTSASLTLDLYNAAFEVNDRADIYLEAHQSDVPETIRLTVGDNWWVGANIGKKGDIISLAQDSVYVADIDYVTGALKLPAEVTFEVSEVPVFQDLQIPINLNDFNAPNGTAIMMEDLFITVKAGETTGTINFEALPNAFTLGTAEKIWIELIPTDTSNPSVVYDNTNWWTGLNITIVAEVWTLSLNQEQSAAIDVLIDDVTTTESVTITIPNVLDKAAPSDLDIQLRFNDGYLPQGTYFESDGMMHIKEGETSGTLTIDVIGSAFAAGESNWLYIELRDYNLPTAPPLLQINPDSWWTWLNVGKN